MSPVRGRACHPPRRVPAAEWEGEAQVATQSEWRGDFSQWSWLGLRIVCILADLLSPAGFALAFGQWCRATLIDSFR